MVSIDIKSTNYQSQRNLEAENIELSDDFFMELSGAMNIPGQNSTSLMQTYQKSNVKPHSIDLNNLKNMGYEGSFWFGNPSQEMQVIFDTGSAWAWLFSEECKNGNCPVKNKRYH